MSMCAWCVYVGVDVCDVCRCVWGVYVGVDVSDMCRCERCVHVGVDMGDVCKCMMCVCGCGVCIMCDHDSVCGDVGVHGVCM